MNYGPVTFNRSLQHVYWGLLTFLGLCSYLLSTDACCLVIILGRQCIMVNFYEAASRGPSSLADILVMRPVFVYFIPLGKLA